VISLTGLRREFDLHPDALYVNAASEGPLPRRAREALLAVLDRKVHPFRLGTEEYFQIPLKTRELCARVAGCRPGEIALTGSTGGGVNLAASALPLDPGDEVLLLSGEFPALVNPFLLARQRGIVVKEVRAAGKWPAPEDFERAASARTRVLAVSHVSSSTGFRHDLPSLGRLCRERSWWFVVDAAQSAGAHPLRFEEDGIHILAAPGHKWLLGPTGTGFAAVRADILEQLPPPAVGWMGCLHNAAQFVSSYPPFDVSRFPGGRRFEIGTTPYLALAAWNASLELLLETGIEVIEGHVGSLLDRLRTRLQGSRYSILSPEDPEHRSGILSLTGRFPAKLLLLLNQRKIFPGLRGGALRFSPHLYNSLEEMDRIAAALRELESAKIEADRKGENL
jgi:selenocysteine lyase/cysteine desulfurase